MAIEADNAGTCSRGERQTRAAANHKRGTTGSRACRIAPVRLCCGAIGPDRTGGGGRVKGKKIMPWFRKENMPLRHHQQKGRVRDGGGYPRRQAALLQCCGYVSDAAKRRI